MSELARIPLAGVIGSPIAHSKSPRLHGYWLNLYGIRGHYIPMDVAPGDLPDVIAALPKAGFVGCNVTIPHKEAVLALADIVTEKLLAKVDWDAVRMNALTSGLLGLWRVKIPWVAVDEEQAIQLALRMCGRPDSLGARVARIRSTLSLGEMAISEALMPEALAAGARPNNALLRTP